MSQFTQNYGQNFIDGLLSAQKFKQFQSDLQTSQIQRQLLEQSLQHQRTMQPLLQAHEQATTDNLNTQRQGFTLANQLAELEQPSKVAEAAGRATEAQARGRTADVQAQTAEATKGQVIGEANLKIQQRLAELLAPGGASITDADILAGLKNAGAVGKEPADWASMLQVMRPVIKQQQQIYQGNQQVLQAHKNELDAQTELQNYAALGKATMVGNDVSDLASKDPTTYMASRDKIQKHLTDTIGDKGAQYVMDLADFKAASAKRDALNKAGTDTTITSNKGLEKNQTNLADLLKTLYDQKFIAEKDLQNQNAGTPGVLYGRNYDKEAQAQAQRKVDLLSKQIKEINSQLTPTQKIIDKTSQNKQSFQGIQNSTDFMNRVSATGDWPPDLLKAFKETNYQPRAGVKPTKENIAALRLTYGL